jgi:Putative beta-barrel porin 2
MRLRVLFVAGCLAAPLALPRLTFAQDPAAEAGAARIHFGPLGLSPTLAVGNIGLDTNVFNTPTDPTRDFTVSVLPATREWLPVGPLLLSGKTGVPLTYFEKSTTQRSVGFAQDARAVLNLVRVTPYAAFGYASSYTQPNAEISVRVQQVTQSVTAGAKVALGARTSLDTSYVTGSVRLPDTVVFGADLGQQLDRNSTSFNATFRMALTSLTTLAVKGALERDRFDSAAIRNTNALSFIPGLELKRDARVSGSVYVGVKDVRPLNPLVAPFTGVVGSAALSWLASDSTRIDGKVDRDIDYSIDESTPLFLATATNLSVTQILVGHVDAVARVGRTLLTYRDLLSSVGAVPLVGRTDRTRTIGSGLGYRFRIDARIGFEADHVRRLSALNGLSYSGWQVGGTMTYGF